jgi:hypothetical protein
MEAFMKRITLFFILTAFFLINAQVSFGAKKIRGSGNVVTEEREVKNITGVKLSTIGDLYIEVGEKEKLEIEAEDNLIPYLEIEVHRGVLKIDTRKNVNLRPKEDISFYLTVKKLERIEISSAGDVFAPDLSADRFFIEVSSAGDLEMGDLNANSVDIEMSSAGDVDMGNINAEKMKVSISSAGDLETKDLDLDFLEVHMSSAGDFWIRNLLAETLKLINTSAGMMEIEGGKVRGQDITLSSAGNYKAKNLESIEARVRLSSVGSATINVKDYLDVSVSSLGSVYYIGNPTVDSRVSSMGRIKKIRD